MGLPSSPNTRKEVYLSNIAGQGTSLPSEPITREEEYLDFIAKNGGGGGGEGDMTKAVYDDDLAVAAAGGIADYVTSAISGKVDKSNTVGLLKNDGTVDTNTYLTSVPLANANSVGGIKAGGQYDTNFSIDAVSGRLEPIFHYPEADGAEGGFALSTDVYNAVTSNTELIKDTVGWTNKNLLENKASSAGIFTVNTDRTVTINGTTSEKHLLTINDNMPIPPAGNYILSSGADSSATTYFLEARVTNSQGSNTNPRDYLNDGALTVTEYTTKIEVYIEVENGQTIDNVVFKPMIRKADIVDATYEPYRKTTAFARDEQRVLGAKNLYKSIATSKTDAYGLTWTVDAVDQNVATVSGTPTGFEAFNTRSNYVLPAGDYILNGILEDTSNIVLNYLGLRNGSTVVQQITCTLVGNNYYFTIPDNISYDNILLTLKRSLNNVACSGTVRLMVRLASDPDGTYVPAALTNTELTKANSLKLFSVDTTGWTADSSSQSGVTLYKKSVSLSHVYKSAPDVSIGASSGLPTTAEQTAYDLIKYVTVDNTVPCLYLYASATPSNSFYINVEGVD